MKHLLLLILKPFMLISEAMASTPVAFTNSFIGVVFITYYKGSFIEALQWMLPVALPTLDAVEVAAQIICTSPAFCLLLWWAGKPLHFCRWWTAETLLPLLPAAEGILAHYDIGGTTLWLASVAIVLLGSLVNGVMVYSKKTNT